MGVPLKYGPESAGMPTPISEFVTKYRFDSVTWESSSLRISGGLNSELTVPRGAGTYVSRSESVLGQCPEYGEVEMMFPGIPESTRALTVARNCGSCA